jgi:hypothetical protein
MRGDTREVTQGGASRGARGILLSVLNNSSSKSFQVIDLMPFNLTIDRHGMRKFKLQNNLQLDFFQPMDFLSAETLPFH